MPVTRRAAFTLVELLVVIAVIAILAAVSIPAVMGALQNARGATTTNKLGEMVKGCASYAASNREYIPLPAKDRSSVNPSFTAATGEENVWYNGLSSHLSIKPLYETTATDFYSSSSIYFLPGAKYKRADLTSTPKFAYGMNVNLANWTASATGERRIKGTTISYPGKTVFFSEGGLEGERTPGALTSKGFQANPSYKAPCGVEAKDFVARYKTSGIIAFADNHVERVSMEKVVTTAFAQQTNKTLTDIHWLSDGSDLP